MNSAENDLKKKKDKSEEVDRLIKSEKNQNGTPTAKRNSKDQSVSDRRASYLDQQGVVQTALAKIVENESPQRKEISYRIQLGMFLNSRIFDIIIIFLVVIYTIQVFINFSFTTDMANSDPDIEMTLVVSAKFELVILIIFIIEILCKIFVFGWKNYFKDPWMIFDAIIILISVILLILDLEMTDSNFKTVSKVLRGIFRFLRLFLVFRKFNQVKRISNVSQRYNVRAPIEKILEILNCLTNEFDDAEIKKELKWAIDKISSNTLYEPLIEEQAGTKDASQWVESIGQKLAKKSQLVENPQQQIEVLNQQQRRESSLQINIPIEVQQLFQNGITNLEFDYFNLYDKYNSLILPYLIDYLFGYYKLYIPLKIDPQMLRAFGEQLGKGYLNNPYHNVIHAFDVTHTVNFYVQTCKFNEIANLTPMDQAILILGAAAHDYAHPGQNNPYQINTKSEIAIKYNDKSPLENMHISQTFYIMRKTECNFSLKFTPEEYKYFRERMISMILSTDMAYHFTDLSKLKARLASSEFDPKDKDKGFCMDILLHAADISNPFKPFSVYEKWTYRVLEEFWIQGDLERDQGLPITYLCDRYTTNVAKSQIGFIDFVVFPFYDTVKGFLPILSEYIPQFETNKNTWKEQIDNYEEELKILNEKKQKLAVK